MIALTDVEFKQATSREPAQIVLSPSSGFSPKPTILYRTLPRYSAARADHVYRAPEAPRAAAVRGRGGIFPEDRALRPDLQLARSDAGVRKVFEHARWFADWVGGEEPP
jgi:hypothetical protein